jgi:hypothetical protein
MGLTPEQLKDSSLEDSRRKENFRFAIIHYNFEVAKCLQGDGYRFAQFSRRNDVHLNSAHLIHVACAQVDEFLPLPRPGNDPVACGQNGAEDMPWVAKTISSLRSKIGADGQNPIVVELWVIMADGKLVARSHSERFPPRQSDTPKHDFRL